MRRRHFLGVLGGAALWPFAARSQGTAAPVIGFLSPSSNSADYVEGLVAGLRELGYVDGRNIRLNPGGPMGSSINSQARRRTRASECRRSGHISD